MIAALSSSTMRYTVITFNIGLEIFLTCSIFNIKDLKALRAADFSNLPCIPTTVLLLSASAEAVLISSWGCISAWPKDCSRCLKSVDWETSLSRNCELFSSLVLFLSSYMPISTWLILSSSSKLYFVRTFSMVDMIFLYWGLCMRRIRECTSE